MGIHHSSDTKTCHDYDNNCQKRHSTASLTNGQRGGRAQTEARGGSAGCRLRCLARGFALGAARVRFGGARRSAPTCDSLPRTTKPNLAACLPPANPPARQAPPASHNAQTTTYHGNILELFYTIKDHPTQHSELFTLTPGNYNYRLKMLIFMS